MSDPLDRDHDGRRGGSLPDPERQRIIAALTEAGIPFFKGASTAALKAKMPETQTEAPAAAQPVEAPPRRSRREKPPEEMVSVKVTKTGADKICTGEWDDENNCADTYLKDEVFTIARSIADELEDRGFVVIQ